MFQTIKSKLSVLLCLIFALCLIFSGCKKAETDTIKIFASTGKYTLIESFSPNTAVSYESGAVMVVSVKALDEEISVTAEFAGEKISLKKDLINTNEQESLSEDFFNFSGSFTLPFTDKDTVIGQVEFTCTKEEISEIYYSGLITVIKGGENSGSNSSVGSKYIAEVMSVPAETFNGDTVDDASLPTNSYLPVGTVDYCSGTAIVNEGIEKSYRLLRFGKRVYDDENIKIYEGKLPSVNKLSLDRCETDGKYTVISFFTDWKAPFTVQLKGQEFINPEEGDFRIKDAAYTHLEIRFMYCDEIIGEIEFDPYNPLFSSGKISYEDNCAVLTLTLKEAGKFYGWRAEYDKSDCLLLRFLEPTRLYTADNEYGIGLYDKLIVVDAGHGGNDPGAVSDDLKESNSNLYLASVLKEELEAAGASVVLTRSDNTPLNTYERYAKVLENEPDFLISIHRNAGPSNGFGSYYYNPFSASASQLIYKETAKAQLYRRTSGSMWHYFYLNRLGICPSVLTENGYINDTEDRTNMISADHQRACAKAIVKGIAEYFKSQHY